MAFDVPKTEAKEEAKEEAGADADADADADEEADYGKPAETEGALSREDFKEVLGAFGAVAFVDYSRGAEKGYVRFEEPEQATAAVAEPTKEAVEELAELSL